MTCAGFEESIARYVGGDLALEEAALVEQHLRSCADCAELARALEEDRVWLASRPPETADVDFAAMRREIRREVARPRWGWGWLAAAAAILLAVGLATMVRRTPVSRRVVSPVVVQAVVAEPVHSLPVAAPKRVRKSRRPQPLPESDSQVEIRIATRDPNVTIILVHEIKGVTQ